MYRKSSIKPPGGALFISNTYKGGGGRQGAYLRGGAIFNLAKTMVSVLQKKLEHKVEMLKYKKLEVMQQRIKNKSELPVGK